MTSAELLQLLAGGTAVALGWRGVAMAAPAAGRVLAAVGKWLAAARQKQAQGDATVLQAEVTGRFDVEKTQVEQDGETERAEITATVNITKLAFDAAESSKRFADGVVKQLTECEDRSRRMEAEHRSHQTRMEADHRRKLQNIVERCNALVVKSVADVSARYERVLADMRQESDARDRKTRDECEPLVAHIEAMERTYQQTNADHKAAVEEVRMLRGQLEDYRARHPSDPAIKAVVPPGSE
jgi:hypothetical protein